MLLPFNIDEYQQRLAKIREEFVAQGLSAIVVTLPDSLNWLTGYDSIGYLWTQVLIIPAVGDVVFITRTTEEPGFNETSYLTQSQAVFYDITATNVVKVIGNTLEDFGLDKSSIGIELQSFTFLPYQWDQLRAQLPNASWSDTTWLVAEARLIKSPTELFYQRQAAEIADIAMESALGSLRPGISEVEVAGIAAKAMGDAGGEYAAIPPMVVSGRRSALVHCMPKRISMSQGDVVCIELGASVNRYHAIVMRTAILGQPTGRLREVHDCLEEGFDAALAAAKPGAKAQEPDDACNAVLVKLDLVRRRCHRIGYSIGLAYPPGWLEPMMLVAGDDHILAPNMSFSLEPNLTLQDEGFGVKLGETAVCTAEGPLSLSRLPHKLTVVN